MLSRLDSNMLTIRRGKGDGGISSYKTILKLPQIYDGTGAFVPAKGTILSKIAPAIDRINYKFHMETSKTKPTLADVIVNMKNDGSGYTAMVSGDTTRVSDVKWDNAQGEYSLYLFGVKDDETPIPTIQQIKDGTATIPTGIPVADVNYVLPHQEIRPGCIYVVTMDTLVCDVNGQYVSKALSGATTSPLTGVVNYTYTPVRFQLTKDSMDNILIRINTVNLGDVSMPELSYFVQTSNVDSDDDSDWKNIKEITNVTGEYTITNLQGINPRNTVYYRIVVRSASVNDRIMSLAMPYRMLDDTSKTPVPKNVSVIGVNLSDAIPGDTERTSDIKIIWDKPANWEDTKDDDIYYHFLLSTGQKDLDPAVKYPLTANGKDYGTGSYSVKYRLVQYVSTKSGLIKENANDNTKLEYTIKGLDLFKGFEGDGTVSAITNPDAYPEFLLPNKTYYLQVYTTLPVDKGNTTDSSKMSEKSLTTSFTTLSLTSRDVPTPNNFQLVSTKVNPATETTPANAVITLRFEDLKIDWSKYTSNHSATDDAVIYDLYMSKQPDLSTFKLIGSSNQADSDVEFKPVISGNTTWINMVINKFSDMDNINSFGYSLSPNTIYYFMIKVRLNLENENPKERESTQTSLLSVTTPRGEPTKPDDNAKKPVAPSDFAIALDKNGNPMVTGHSVTFEWTVKENEASYNLISTAKKVALDTPDTDPSILEDPTYISYISVFGDKDGNIDGNSQKLTLDPKASPLPPNLVYDSKTKKCRYTINTWLYPNRVYYFSLRSEVVEANKSKSSVWISIPVTTSLIESPTMLQTISDCELSFYWFDTNPQTTADSYSIKIKAANDKNYTQLTKAQYNIVKDGSVYYGRIYKLKSNTQYNIQVVRTIDNAVLSNTTQSTRNDYYQIEVKWQGIEVDDYTGYEIAIKTEDDTDYKVLSNSDLEQYIDITRHTYPYYIEKTFNNLGTEYYTYTARIKYAEVTLSNGTKEHKPLKPNTKYYIKVRAYKKDPSNLEAITRSKYIGPVNTRTEFNQGDYDDNDKNTNITAKFLDMIDKLEQGLYWDVNKGSSSTMAKVYVKDDKVVNLLEGPGYTSCTIDISQIPAYINTDEVYMAKNILTAMKTYNKSVIIKTKNIEFTIRPDTFDINNMEEFKKAREAAGAKDVYLKLDNIQTGEIQPKAPANTTSVSKVNILTAQAVASRETSENIKDMIKDKLYNEDTGIIKKKLDVIKNPNNPNIKGSDASIDKYLNQLIEEIKSELSYYINDTLNGANYSSGFFAEKFDIAGYNSPMSVKMSYKGNTVANPYVLYGNAGNWQKLTQNLKYDTGYVTFLVSSPGKYTVFGGKDVTATIGDESPAKPYITKLAGKYDLTLVFAGAGESYNPDLSVSVKEAITLYELVSDSQVDNTTDVKIKAKNYGLDKIINISNVNRNITRQETAALIIKLYCQRTGADYNRLRASYNKIIKDDSAIEAKYATPVYACLNMNIMTLDTSSKFNPSLSINRKDIVVAFEKMLEA
ncbi:hypothetical protein [Ruminiclostridium josui]|uniref:hypothetical protein n=1 Tax=Ruminiclostridium josui TaxID=1499 RepID=UPI001FA79F5D|nr:hypothetical protein [Ruminiclostridium josui]